MGRCKIFKGQRFDVTLFADTDKDAMSMAVEDMDPFHHAQTMPTVEVLGVIKESQCLKAS